MIQGTAPRSIAVWRDGDGLAIGTLDAAGGVHLVRTTAAGAVRSRASAAATQPATEIASTPEGLLILRADQALELVDAGGAMRGRLVPEPGTRIDSLVARAGRVLALIQEDKQLHGRWVVLRGGVQWGDTTPPLPFAISHAVLSPRGDLLAVSRPRSLHPALIELANGTARKTPLCVSKQWPHENDDDTSSDRQLLKSDNAPLPLGFLTDKVVACAVMTSLLWWDVEGSQHPNAAGSATVSRLPLAMTDRGLIVATGGNLGMLAPEANQFLGYGMRGLENLRVSSGAVLVSGPDQEALVLDAGLRERSRFAVRRGRGGWDDFAAIDDRFAIGSESRRWPEHRDSRYQLAVFDGLTMSVHQLLPYLARDKEVSYAPESRLLATSDGQMALLLRFDPVNHTFGDPVRIGSAVSPARLAVLDPGLSGGVVALEIDDASDGLLVGELRDGDLQPGTTVQPHIAYRVPGELRAVDRAGHLYVHRPDDHDDVVVYARDVMVARLPEVAGLVLRPNADGSRIAAFKTPRLVLLDGQGHARWDTAQWSGAEVAWTASGELMVQFPTGVGRIDLETGALADRRCGWGFGLSDQPLDGRLGGPSICDAE